MLRAGGEVVAAEEVNPRGAVARFYSPESIDGKRTQGWCPA